MIAPVRTFDRDLELVLPMWHGGHDRRLVQGADALAARIPERAQRQRVAPPLVGDGPMRDGIARLAAVREHLDAARRALDHHRPRRLLTVGGDCTGETPSIGRLLQVHPDLRVVWFDAHGDLNTPSSSTSGAAHGMPLRALLGDGHPAMVPTAVILTPSRVLLAGVRDLDPAESEYIERQDLRMLAPRALVADPTGAAGWLPAAAPVYVHVDLDVLDPEVWPAVEVPVAGGLSIDTLAEALRAVMDRGDVVGIGLTEHVPTDGWDLAHLDPILTALQLR